MLNCLICHLLWCQDVLFSEWHSVVNCNILDISKCLCWEVCGLLRVSTRKCCWSLSVLWDLLFVAARGITHPAISRQHSRNFWSSPVIFPNSLPVLLLCEGFRRLHLLCLLFCSSLALHIQYSSDITCKYDIRKINIGHEAIVISYRSGLQRVNMLLRCSAYCSQFYLIWSGCVLYYIILCTVLYSIRGNLSLGSSCAQNYVILAHELNMNQVCDAGKKKASLILWGTKRMGIGKTWEVCDWISFGVSKPKKDVGIFASFQGRSTRIKSLENQQQTRMG